MVYAALAVLAFSLAAGVGAIGALMMQGDLSFPGREGSGAGDDQADASRLQQEQGASRPGEAGEQETSQRSEPDEREVTPRPELAPSVGEQHEAAGQKDESPEEREQAAARQDETEYVTRARSEERRVGKECRS